MHAERVNHHEDDAHERCEHHVDGVGQQLLDVRPDLLQLAQRFAAALILEDRIRQLERMADAVGIELGAEPLRDHVDVVVLEVLGDARDKRHAHGGAQQQAHAAEELPGRVLLETRRIPVDHIPEDERIEQREHLVDRGQDERQRDERPVVPEIAEEQIHEDRPAPRRGNSRGDRRRC